MSFSAWLDVAIGLAVVYLGASLFVTIIGEYVSQTLNLRGRALWKAVRKLIPDQAQRTALAKNAALAPFFGGEKFKDKNNAPSYVDPVVVARALLGAGTSGGKPALAAPLAEAVGVVGKDVDQAVAAVSHWVDSSLTVLSESFKRYQRWVSFFTALVIAALLNLDTVALTTRLYRDKEARDATVAVAVDVTSKVDKAVFDACYALGPDDRAKDPKCAPVLGLVSAVRGRNASLGTLPIGWASAPWRTDDAVAWLVRIIGLFLTTLALSLGAPFWFDLLSKLVDVRNGIRRPNVREGLATSGAALPSEDAKRRAA